MPAMNLYNGQEPDYDSILQDLDYSSEGLSVKFQNQLFALLDNLDSLGCSKEFIHKVGMEAVRRFVNYKHPEE